MVIITGAAGFVGRYLVDQLLKDGFEVLATGRSHGRSLLPKAGNPLSLESILGEYVNFYVILFSALKEGK
jgi:nucleoside-diphosphate-sugar epimerase